MNSKIQVLLRCRNFKLKPIVDWHADVESKKKAIQRPLVLRRRGHTSDLRIAVHIL